METTELDPLVYCNLLDATVVLATPLIGRPNG